jgi:membrane protein implicated in regulation of membrane protease activity
VNESLKQLFNGFLVILGGGLLVYSLTVTGASVYMQIIGLLILMIGAYRASKHWAAHKDDHLDE